MAVIKDIPKIKSLSELGKVLTQMDIIKHPDFPYPTVKTYTDKKANDLTKAVIAFFYAYNCLAWRQNNVGIYDEKTGTRRAGTTKKGIGDVSACWFGRSIQVEIKIGKDRMSQHQIKFRDQLEASGGVYFVAKKFNQFTSDFWNWYDGKRNNPEQSKQMELFTAPKEVIEVPCITWAELDREMWADKDNKTGMSYLYRETPEQKQAALDEGKSGLNAPVSQKIVDFVRVMFDQVESERKK